MGSTVLSKQTLKNKYGFFVSQSNQVESSDFTHPVLRSRERKFSVSVYWPGHAGEPEKNSGALLQFAPPDSYHMGLNRFSILFTEHYLCKDKQLYELVASLPFFQFSALDAGPFTLEPPQAPAILATCQSIYEEYHADNNDQLDIINAYVFTLLLLARRVYTSRGREQAIPFGSPLVARFMALLNEEHFTSGKNTDYLRSVAWYAQQLHVTPSHLTFTLKKETGKTAHDIIMERIIHFSKLLLIKTTQSIKEIAYQFDFYDGPHFSLMFKKYTGLSPKAFRAIARNNRPYGAENMYF